MLWNRGRLRNLGLRRQANRKHDSHNAKYLQDSSVKTCRA